MNDEERFDLVLSELGRLLLALGDLSNHIVLVGGQVPSLLGRVKSGSGVNRVETETGIVVERGYSFEPDLLFDPEGAGFQSDNLVNVLAVAASNA